MLARLAAEAVVGAGAGSRFHVDQIAVVPGERLDHEGPRLRSGSNPDPILCQGLGGAGDAGGVQVLDRQPPTSIGSSMAARRRSSGTSPSASLTATLQASATSS